MYKVGDYQFKIQEHPTNTFNEVSHWLKSNFFESCVQIFEMKQIRNLSQLVQQITRSDLEQLGLEQKEIDRFMNLIDLMKRNMLHSQTQASGPKKQLILTFT